MSKRSYKFNPAAEHDLAEHGNFLLTKISEDAAITFFRGVYRTCGLLAGLPYIGQQTEGHPEYREFGVRRSYGMRLVYKVFPDSIEIVRVISRNQYWIP